jgi:hypothetical protein
VKRQRQRTTGGGVALTGHWLAGFGSGISLIGSYGLSKRNKASKDYSL